MQAMKEMPYVIGLQIRIYPSNKQKDIIAYNDGVARFVYNTLVARNQELHMLKKVNCYLEPVAKRINYLESLGTKSSDLKAAYPFLEDKRVDAQTIANATKNYNTSWNNFRKVPGTSMPHFHKKSYEKSYQTNAHYPKDANLISDGNVYLTDKKHITLPKLGRIKFKGSKLIQAVFDRCNETRIGTIKIFMNAIGEYYASLQIGSAYPFHEEKHKTGKVVGIDVNIENFYTDSEGNVVDNPRFTKKFAHQLSKNQRKLSRRMEVAKKEKRSIYKSSNYQKQRLKVAKLNIYKARLRDEFQHIESKKLVESQDYIFVEDLKVKNLLKNHKLAKAISDCAWTEFMRKLDYKCAFYGKTLIKVAAKNTTQTCSTCGYVLKGRETLTLIDREWTCPSCNDYHKRDHNSAINIKTKGLTMVR